MHGLAIRFNDQRSVHLSQGHVLNALKARQDCCRVGHQFTNYLDSLCPAHLPLDRHVASARINLEHVFPFILQVVTKLKKECFFGELQDLVLRLNIIYGDVSFPLRVFQCLQTLR